MHTLEAGVSVLGILKVSLILGLLLVIRVLLEPPDTEGEKPIPRALRSTAKIVVEALIVFLLVAESLEVPHFRDIVRQELRSIVFEKIETPEFIAKNFTPPRVQALQRGAFAAARPDTCLPTGFESAVDMFGGWASGCMREELEVFRKIDERNSRWRIVQTATSVLNPGIESFPPVLATVRVVPGVPNAELFRLSKLELNGQDVPCESHVDKDTVDALGRKMVRFRGGPVAASAPVGRITSYRITTETWTPIGDPWLGWMSRPTHKLVVRIQAKDECLRHLEFWRFDPSRPERDALLPGTPIEEPGSVNGVKTHQWTYDKWLLPGHSFVVLWHPLDPPKTLKAQHKQSRRRR